MNSDPTDADLKALWQSQAIEEFPMPLEEIRKRARRLQGRVQRRNAMEYFAGGVVVAAFVSASITHALPLVKIGCAAVALGAVIALWQLHARGSARRTPDASATALADFHRRELVRQRDAQASVALWYLAPFAPGMALVLLGRWLSPIDEVGRSATTDRIMIAMTGILMLLVFLVVFLANRLGAQRLQKQIDEIDALRKY
jgi:hypothetical protein